MASKGSGQGASAPAGSADASEGASVADEHYLMPFVYSAAAGAIGSAISHPFNTWAVFRSTNRPVPWGTPLAFYRGLAPASLQGAIVYGVLLGTYEKLVKVYGFEWYTAALISTVPESIIRGPLEAVTNMQQTLHRPTGAALVKTLAKGTFGTWVRECPGNLVYFGAFDYIRSNTDSSTLVASTVTGALYGAVVFPFEAMRAQVSTGSPIRFTYQGAMPYIGRCVTMIPGTFVSFKILSGRDMGGH